MDYDYPFQAEETFLEEAGHDGRRDRLRRRIDRHGFDGVPDHEILEFLLGYAIPRQDTNELARAMLEYFGDLKKALHSGYEEIAQVEGMGEEAARWMAMVNGFIDLCDRVRFIKGMILKNYGQVFTLSGEMWRSVRRSCVQLCIDRYGRLVHYFALPEDMRWQEPESMSMLAHHAVCSKGHSIVLVMMMDQYRIMTGREADAIQEYAVILGDTDVLLADVVISTPRRAISLRQKGYIVDKRLSKNKCTLRENYMRGMPESGEMDYETLSRGYVMPEMDPVE